MFQMSQSNGVLSRVCRLRDLRRGARFAADSRRLHFDALEDRRLLAAVTPMDLGAADVADVDTTLAETRTSNHVTYNPRMEVKPDGVERITPLGDFTLDGVLDIHDIDALVVEIATASKDTWFDLTGDGEVTLADRDAWLQVAGHTNLGLGLSYRVSDANLDGLVDGSDYNIWNANKFRPNDNIPGWSQGNFNADSYVDGSDFNLWNANKMTSSIKQPKVKPLEEKQVDEEEDASDGGVAICYAYHPMFFIE